MKSSIILINFIQDVIYRTDLTGPQFECYVFAFESISYNGAWEYMPGASRHHLVIVEHQSNWKLK